MAKILETLAERAHKAIGITGLSQAEFARQAKIKLRTLQDILGGKSINPEMSTLQGISSRSGMSLDELVFGKFNQEPESSALPAVTTADLFKSEERIIKALEETALKGVLPKKKTEWLKDLMSIWDQVPEDIQLEITNLAFTSLKDPKYAREFMEMTVERSRKKRAESKAKEPQKHIAHRKASSSGS